MEKHKSNIYGIYNGSILDIFIKEVSKNSSHFKYNELKNKYPIYFI